MKIKIKYLPQNRWQLILGDDASPATGVDIPIMFGGYLALSNFYGSDEYVVKIGEIIPNSEIEFVDETWPPEMNEDNPSIEER